MHEEIPKEGLVDKAHDKWLGLEGRIKVIKESSLYDPMKTVDIFLVPKDF